MTKFCFHLFHLFVLLLITVSYFHVYKMLLKINISMDFVNIFICFSVFADQLLSGGMTFLDFNVYFPKLGRVYIMARKLELILKEHSTHWTKFRITTQFEAHGLVNIFWDFKQNSIIPYGVLSTLSQNPWGLPLIWLVMSLVLYEYSCTPVIIIVHYAMILFSLTEGPRPIHCSCSCIFIEHQWQTQIYVLDHELQIVWLF